MSDYSKRTAPNDSYFSFVNNPNFPARNRNPDQIRAQKSRYSVFVLMRNVL